MRSLLTMLTLSLLTFSSVSFASKSSNVECSQKTASSAANLSEQDSLNLVASLTREAKPRSQRGSVRGGTATR